MKLESLVRHEKWFDVPGHDGAKVLILEMFDFDARGYMEGAISIGAGTAAKLGRDVLLQLRMDAVGSWIGIVDDKGVALPVTAFNKNLFLMQQIEVGGEKKRMEFLVEEWMAEVKDEGEKLRSDAEKN